MKFQNDPIHTFPTCEDFIAKHLREETPLDHLPTIPQFYKGREIFITGGTGFIGKVLIEKLLRSCPDIKTIYLLIREKKGLSLNERLQYLVQLNLFNILRIKFPNFALKLIPVEGDVTKIELGLSETNKTLMRNVSIIFHSAASVRFDDTLKYAVIMNTRGTRELMKFAESLSKIKVVMHVSTTYSNVHLHTVEEKIYPPLADWKKIIEICEKSEENKVDWLTQHFINFMPNTYVFSKNLAEHVTLAHKGKLPLILFRPSVVLSAYQEPFAGYVDNFNGPMGIMLASCAGISKTMYADRKNILDVTPVDVCVKAMIVAAWKRAYEPIDFLPVINCATSNQVHLTLNQILDMGTYGVCMEFPMGKKMLMLPSGGVTLCKSWNVIRLFILQIIPAYLADRLVKFKGKSGRLMKLQRKMYAANKALSYFVTHNWNFKNENFINLVHYIRPEDKMNFDYHHFFTFDIILFIRSTVYGFRKYLMHLKDEDLEKDRKYANNLATFTKFSKIFITFLVLFLIHSKYFLE